MSLFAKVGLSLGSSDPKYRIILPKLHCIISGYVSMTDNNGKGPISCNLRRNTKKSKKKKTLFFIFYYFF